MSPVRPPLAIEATRPGDARYPEALGDLRRPPQVLWSIGDWSVLQPPVIAIVGTRAATAYGERMTRELAGALARAGACIISGMALGVDGVAHRAALDAGGRTVAVLGTGVDVAYPRAHRALHREIAERGLLLSELEPGAHSHRGSFPERNRIIAALALATIVVEAGAKSGALITVGHAEVLDRTVGAVPGPIDAPQSVGTNLLIRDGRLAVTSIADALAIAGLTPPALGGTEPGDPVERMVWQVLRRGPLDIDALCAAAALPAQDCLAAVTALEIRGVLECELTGQIRLR